MAFILDPVSGGQDLMINGWNWRSLIAMLVRAKVLPEGERAERCLANGSGGYLNSLEAEQAAGYIDAMLLEMTPSQRIRVDGTTTDAPIDFTKPISEWNDVDSYNNYSVSHEMLAKFSEFCRRSQGFDVL